MTAPVDVCVIGAGPAGLAAACVAAEHGLDVVLLDEQPRPGGQYYRQASAAVSALVGEHRPAGRELIARAERAGVRFRGATSVWGVADDGRSLMTWHAEAGVEVVRAQHVVVATGASERTIPFPGWTSPRVTTVGHAQHLASEGVRIGDRVLVAGSGPFLLPVACALVQCGARVVAVLEAGTPYRVGPSATVALRHPARLAEFLRYRARLARAGVPVRTGRSVASASDDGRALTVLDEPVGRGRQRSYTVDALCVGYGFRAQIELLRLLGCPTAVDPASGDETVAVDVHGRTGAAGVWAAGEVAGIAGAACAVAEGEVVGAAVAAALGIAVRPARSALRRTVRGRAFATALASRYPAPRSLATRAAATLPDPTVVCRCEAVTAGAVRRASRAMDLGSEPALDAVKAATRAGMGPCQGRECAPALAGLCGVRTSAFTARAPIRPVPLGALADVVTP